MYEQNKVYASRDLSRSKTYNYELKILFEKEFITKNWKSLIILQALIYRKSKKKKKKRKKKEKKRNLKNAIKTIVKFLTSFNFL